MDRADNKFIEMQQSMRRLTASGWGVALTLLGATIVLALNLAFGGFGT